MNQWEELLRGSLLKRFLILFLLYIVLHFANTALLAPKLAADDFLVGAQFEDYLGTHIILLLALVLLVA